MMELDLIAERAAILADRGGRPARSSVIGCNTETAAVWLEVQREWNIQSGQADTVN